MTPCEHIGQRVRVIWNPQIMRWAVYSLTDDRPFLHTKRLELHTVGVYGELKPKFAQDGSPSFIGTIASNEIVQKGDNHEVIPHPYCPSKLYFGGTVNVFNHSRRILLDGSKMFATPERTIDVT